VFEILIVVFLVVLNGVFALSELAIVSARRSKLKALAKAGKNGARSALALTDDPGRFLSTVQIGITLVGVIAGAFSGATLGVALEQHLIDVGVSRDIAEFLGLGLVIVAITYLSLIIGELVPKSLALRNPEGIACTVAPLMTYIARFASPLVWLLDTSTKLVLKLTGEAPEKTGVTEEELKAIVGEAETSGVLESGERAMIAGVMRLGDRAVLGIMTPRTDVDWIDLTASEAEIRTLLLDSNHSRLPVGEGSADAMVGVVQTRELLAALLLGKPFDVRVYAKEAPIIPDTMDALDALKVLREAPVPMALIHDEYGHFEGLVTPNDILEAIAGVFHSDSEGREPYAVERADGSWLLAGAMPADEMADVLDIVLPGDRDYQTVAGFILGLMHHRIDKVLAARPQPLRHRLG
jgi:putative hemolysin